MDIHKLFDLSGKPAVVTSDADGISKGSCEILASAGANIVISDIDITKAEEVA